MKTLTKHISEKLIINKNFKRLCCSESPKSFDELKNIIGERNLKNRTELDLSDIYTGYVNEFSIFQGSYYNSVFGRTFPKGLKIIDVTGWDLTNTRSIGGLFSSFDELEEIRGLETWDVSNINDMSHLFRWCEKLKSINIENWNVKKSCKIDEMFTLCPARIPQWYKDRIK